MVKNVNKIQLQVLSSHDESYILHLWAQDLNRLNNGLSWTINTMVY